MADMGEHWDHLADKAYKSGCLETPRQHCLRAAAYFHYAQLRLHDSLMKEGLRRACRRAYEKYATLADPPIVRCEIPFQSMVLPGYLRVRKPGPCVILIGGLDSAKEVELHHFAEVFFNRCCSVFYFDGPGQGELYGRSSMASGFENAVSSVIKFLSSDPRAQAGRIGCFGVSFGGYLACLSSAANPRVSACISIGGFFDHRILPKLPPVAAGTVRERQVGERYGVWGYPETFIIDRNGYVVERVIGPRDWATPAQLAALEALIAADGDGANASAPRGPS